MAQDLPSSFQFIDNLSANKDRVRNLLGDVNYSNPLVSDDAITNMLTVFGSNIWLTAAALADGLAARFAMTPSITVDGLVVDGARRSKMFRDLAQNLRRQATESAPGGIGVPFVGGISMGTIEDIRDDSDRPPAAFELGIDDNNED